MSVFAALALVAVTSSQHPNLNATLWYQTSAEFRANSLQTYKLASHQLAAAIADKQWTALPSQHGDLTKLPPAIIVDIDETILDNSPSAAQDVLEGKLNYDAASWDRWVSLAKAAAVPGAVALLNQAATLGVTVLYISNRECKTRQEQTTKPVNSCPQKADTLANLKAVGIKNVSDKQIWLKSEQPDWTSEKESRRQLAQQQYRVVMLFGDDLGDFLPNVKKNITPAKRAQIVDTHQAYWGEKWFMLTNPTYGSWETILEAPKTNYLRGF